MAKISVIVPNYNTANFLPRCLESLREQTEKDIEFLLIDDASEDNSLEVMERYQKIDSRFKIFSFPINQGVSIARNKGIEEATGAYIGFVDSDDYIDFNYYESLLDRIEQTNVPLSVAALYIKKWERKYVCSNVYNFKNKLVPLEMGNASSCTHLFERDLIGEDRFLEHCRYEDSAFTFLMHMKSGMIAGTDKAYYYYCDDNPHSFSHTPMSIKRFLDQMRVADYFEEVAKQKGFYELYQEKIKRLQFGFLDNFTKMLRCLLPSGEEVCDLYTHLGVLLEKKYGNFLESDVVSMGTKLLMMRYDCNDLLKEQLKEMPLDLCEVSFQKKLQKYVKEKQ